MTFAPGAEWNSVFNGFKELVLTGSNTAENVFRACMIFKNNVTGRYYLTKRGTGTWVMGYKYANIISHENRPVLAGIGVEEGTLKVESIYEKDVNCSIGPGTSCLGYAYKGPADSAPAEAAFAIRLGAANDFSKEGTLHYCGLEDVEVSTRPIGITGRGRLVNGTGKMFRYWGLLGAVPPEGGSTPTNVLTLAGDSTTAVNDLADITEEDGSEPLSVAKDGAGTWTLRGTVDFTGGVTVNEGTLAIENLSHYTWYRFTITENLAGSDHPTAGKTSGETYSVLGELGLFASDGTRQNAGLLRWSRNEAGATVGRMASGYVAYGRANGPNPSGKGLERLFDGVGDQEWLISYKKVTTNDTDTHFPIVMHLADSAKKIASLDVCHPYGLTSAYENSKATQFTFEGSADGKTWHLLTNVTDLVLRKEDGWSYANTDIVSAETPVTGTLPLPDTTVPAAERDTVLPNGLAKLKVRPGATFRVWGDAVAVKALEVDAAGMGSVAGVSFPATGTIDIQSAGSDLALGTIPLNLGSLEGAANLAHWTVTHNGGPSKRYLFHPSADGIRVTKRGLVLFLR